MRILLAIILFFAFSITSFSHSKLTDSSGGYNDNVNGGYHYHNGETAIASKPGKQTNGVVRSITDGDTFRPNGNKIKNVARHSHRKARSSKLTKKKKAAKKKAAKKRAAKKKAAKKAAKKRAATATRKKTSGVVRSITDGDTFNLNGNKIRVCGINAPERGAKGGSESTAYLTRILKGKRAVCRPVGRGTPCDGKSKRTSHGRVVAQCFVGGKDLACMMVRAGHAKDYRRHSGGYYAKCR